MPSRREFMAILSRWSAALGLASFPLAAAVRSAWAGKMQRRKLTSDTELDALVRLDPAELDTSDYPVTPLEGFRTMGLSDHSVNLDRWRLEIGGEVAEPFALSHDQLAELPVVERNVLLICPGVFALHGRWRGVSIYSLLQRAGLVDGAAGVVVRGPEGPYEKKERFPIEEVKSGKVFLARGVNGVPLPRKHGFPLRLVAEDHYGHRWVKYVQRIEAVKG
ncbi:MAG: molybdopterin-dependent oxidoreductase [Desulfobacteraceae bacterium]|nr:molybdopterin-dependent oxidoreductase [Desulfobacteraceae bacterium]